MTSNFADSQQLSYKALERLLSALSLARQGDFSVRMQADGDGMEREVADSLNELLTTLALCTSELERAAEGVSQGELRGRITLDKTGGGWGQQVRAVNGIVTVFAKHAVETRRVIKSMLAGDFSRLITIGPEAVHRGGELARTAEDMNAMIVYVDRTTTEVTRVFAEVGLDGRLNAQCHMGDSSGSWAMLLGSVNAASASLAEQVQDLSATAHALAQGNLSARASITSRGDLQGLKVGLNGAADAVAALCGELRRIVHAVTNEGRLSVEMQLPNARGELQSLQDAVNRLFLTYARTLRSACEATQRIERDEPAQPETPPPAELGAVARQLAKLAEREERTQNGLEQLAEGRFDAVGLGDSAREVVLAKIGSQIKRDWLRSARVALLEARDRHSEPVAFTREALRAVAVACGAEIGAYHVVTSEGAFTRVASYGWQLPEGSASVTLPGEGLIGRAALERAPLILDQLEGEAVRIRSSLIELVPRSLLIFPVMGEAGVVAIVELGFLRASATVARELLSFVAADLARGPRVQDGASSALEHGQLRAAEEELVIANTRLVHMSQELRARDSALRELQQTVQTLRGTSTAPARVP
jgi:HAMP domain-containing protein